MMTHETVDVSPLIGGDLRQEQIPNEEQKMFLVELAKSATRPGCRFLEVGSWCGDSAVLLGRVAQEHGGHLFCVDWWKGSPGTELAGIASREDVFAFFWGRIRQEGLEDTVIPIRARSSDIAQVLRAGQFDLVFIDGDHRYESVLWDIREYSSLVRRDGGIFCGDDCVGRLSDFTPEFLQAGKGVNFHESVHCGVVLAVGESFKDYSVNYNLWSVRARGEEGGWGPTDLTLSGVPDRSQPPPQPIGYTKNYTLLRYRKSVYAVPFSLVPFDVTDDEQRKRPEVLSALTRQEVEALIGEKEVSRVVPVLLESFEDYNLVRYGDQVYAFSHALGPIDLATEKGTEAISKHQKTGKCLVGSSLADIKRALKIISLLERQLAEKSSRFDALEIQREREVVERDRIIGGLAERIAELAAELNRIKSTWWYRLVGDMVRLRGRFYAILPSSFKSRLINKIPQEPSK